MNRPQFQLLKSRKRLISMGCKFSIMTFSYYDYGLIELRWRSINCLPARSSLTGMSN
jgi:hypothetical protein